MPRAGPRGEILKVSAGIIVMCIRNAARFLCCLALLCVVGCSEADERAAVGAAAVAKARVQSASTATVRKQTTLPEGPIFAAPYPNRGNPFIYVGSLDGSSESPFAGSLKDIVVRGFLATDAPAVLLEIDGSLHTVRAGQTVAGVEVISISQPRVTLRTQEAEWTTSLFEAR